MRKVLDWRRRIGMPKHTLGREHNQRLAPMRERLPTEQVEVLCRIRRLTNLEIVPRSQLQESLDASAGVFRALAFVSMRQKQNQSREQAPFILACTYKLIDDGLGHIGEVSELRLPQHQRLGIIAAIAIFKAEHSRFGQSRVVYVAPSLIRRDVLQRYVFVLV